VHTENFNETVEADLDSLSPAGKNHWANYALGVAWALERAGKRLNGANLLIAGEVPLGAGLSSSAAVEVATGATLLGESGSEIDHLALARLCQQAENEFAGARCGIMDQFVACHGQASCALLLDCRSLAFELVRVPPGIQIVICNTMVKHELGSSEYNSRRAECEEGLLRLQKVLPGVHALRDVSVAQLEAHRALLAEKVFARCRHVITENMRVQEAVRALKKGDLRALGPLMRDSHRSLRDDYEVSCMELNAMTDIAAAQHGVIGCRMTGGGFGGCTVNLVQDAAVGAFQQNVAQQYKARTGIQPEVYVSRAADGMQRVEICEEESNE
jgi:galactokinase